MDQVDEGHRVVLVERVTAHRHGDRIGEADEPVLGDHDRLVRVLDDEPVLFLRGRQRRGDRMALRRFERQRDHRGDRRAELDLVVLPLPRLADVREAEHAGHPSVEPDADVERRGDTEQLQVRIGEFARRRIFPRAIGDHRSMRGERGEPAGMPHRVDLRARRGPFVGVRALHVDFRALAGQRVAGQAPVADALDAQHLRGGLEDRRQRRVEVGLVQLRQLVQRIAETQRALVALVGVALAGLAQRDVADEGAEAERVAGRDRPHGELDRKLGAQPVQRRQLDRSVQDVRLARREVARDPPLMTFAVADRHDELRQQLPARLFARPAERALGLRIPFVDAPRSVDDDHRLGRRGDHRRQSLAAFAQRALGRFVPRDLLAQQRIDAQQLLGAGRDALLEVFADCWVCAVIDQIWILAFFATCPGLPVPWSESAAAGGCPLQ
jgi:hypothetical protein